MSSSLKRSQLLKVISVFTGFLFFFLNYSCLSPLLLIPFIAFCISLFTKIGRDNRLFESFYFYSTGFLVLFMKFFYWDSEDFKIRVGYLLLISLFFSVYSIFKRNKLLDKILSFFNGKTLKMRMVILFLLSQLIFISASGIIVMKGVELIGDEPHYLAISQSISKDGDINVFNQYARDEYREFINYRLAHHSKVGKGFKKWYSFHLPGLSVTLAPFFLLKIPVPLLYFLIRVFLGLFGSLLGVLVYVLSLKIWKKEKLSLFIFSVFLFTTPVFFLSIHVFAELQALLLILLSIWFCLFKDNLNRKHLLLSGFFLGMTVFWGMKYIIFIAIFTITFFIFSLRKKDIKSGIVFSIFPTVFILLFFLYLFFAYGNFSPMSVYTGVLTESQRAEYTEGMKGIKIQNRFETLFDYFFDQRDGLLLYNPFYFFFFPGLIIAIKKIKKYYSHLIISIASFVYLLYHGYSTVRPGYCPQARYVLPVVWTLMLFSVIYYIESKNKVFKRLFLFFPVYSFFTTIYQIFNPFTLYQSTTHNYIDRSGLIFQKLGNIHLDISTILPSFIKVDGNFKYLPNLIFLIFFVLFIFLSLRDLKINRIKYTPIILFIILFSLFSLFPRPQLYNPWKVKTETGISFLTHGNIYPKSDIFEEYVTEIKKGRRDSITISTIKKLNGVDLLISGQKNSGELTISVNDLPAKVIGIKKGIKEECFIGFTIFKKIKKRYFYTIRFNFDKKLNEGFNVRVIPK